MEKFFNVSNWEEHTHYKDRPTLWIKIYNSMLDDYKFGQLSDVSKGHLFSIILLASKHNNKLPWDEKWIGHRIQASNPVNLNELEELGFIIAIEETASKPLAKKKSDASRMLAQNRIEKNRIEKNRVNTPLTPLEGGESAPEKHRQDEQTVEASSEVTGWAKTPAVPKAKAWEKAFASFWQAYPKRMNKGQAEKAWLQLNPDEQLTVKILQAVERAKTTEKWQKDGGQFIPYPATWLRAKGWEDDHKEAWNGADKVGFGKRAEREWAERTEGLRAFLDERKT